jgi:hypothetical protein
MKVLHLGSFHSLLTVWSPWVPPYLVEARNNNPVPYFPWPVPKPIPVYHHAVMRDYYLHTLVGHYREGRSITGMLKTDVVALVRLRVFYFGPELSLPVLVALSSLPYGFSWTNIHTDTRFLLLVCATSLAGSMVTLWFYPHYAAPMASATLALVLQAMRRLRSQVGRGQSVGVFMVRAVPLICLLMLALRVEARPLSLECKWPEAASLSWCTSGPKNLARAMTAAGLRRYPGRHLAIVHYGPQHDVWYNEWVYNEADIDRAKVVWARDMGPAQNKELIDYFRDRQVWLVEADDTPPKVLPYEASR